METLTGAVTAEEIAVHVARHPFLVGMNKHHIELLARYAKPVHFEPGETIFRSGERANGFYLIEKGSVDLEGSVMEHGTIRTDTVIAGEPLGWSWLFPPFVWHFDARASEPTTALFFDGETLRKHYDEDLTLGHDLFKRISRVMVRRLQLARRKFAEAAASRKAPEI